MLHNGGPVPSYAQPMPYYDYAGQNGAQLHPTFKEYEGRAYGLFPEAVKGGRCDEEQPGMPDPKGCGEVSPVANFERLDYSSPEAHPAASPESAAKPVLPTFAWMINSSEDGMIFCSNYSILYTVKSE